MSNPKLNFMTYGEAHFGNVCVENVLQQHSFRLRMTRDRELMVFVWIW